MQHGLAGLQRAHDVLRGGVDDLHAVVVRHREVHPHLAAVGTGHHEHGLSSHRDAADLLPGVGVHHQHLVAADGGQVGAAPGHGPAAQVRHLVDRQGLLATAVAAQDAAHGGLVFPQVHHGQAVLAEQARDVVAAIGRDQRVIGLLANVGQLGGNGACGVGQVGDPDGVGVEQAVGEAPSRQVHQPDYARELAVLVFGRDVGHQLQRGGVEGLDAAGRVVLCHHQAAVGADGAANRVARLHHAASDAVREQIDLGERAVAPKHKGVAAVAREHHRCVREVAQALDLGQQCALAGVDDGQCARGPRHDDAEIARAGGGRDAGASGQQQGRGAHQGEAVAAFHRESFCGSGNPAISCWAIHRASASFTMAFQGAMGVPGRPP